MLYLVRNGVEYALDDGSLCWLIGLDGWGMSPQHRLTERGPLQHGDSDRGYRLDPRIGVIGLHVQGLSREDMYVKRDQLIDLFAPTGNLSLRWVLNAYSRQIDVVFSGHMSFSSNDQEGFNIKTAVSLRASDPTFYDPAGVAVTFSLGGGSDALTIPMTVPMVVGASILDASNAVDNDGNWISFPHLIRITGPITNAVITNTTTGEVLSFVGTTIAGGTYYDIDLRYGRKTVTDSAGVNQISKLAADSDLATWHLEPGTNSINVVGTSVTEATTVQLNFFMRYMGV